MTDIIVAFILSSLYGIFKAVTDIRRDQPNTNWLFYHLSYRFYFGGGYSQRFPWDQDLWHLADDLKLLVLLIAFAYPTPEYWYLYPLPMYFWAGRTFSLFYHYLLPDERAPLARWLVCSIAFWLPENK